MSFSTSGRGWCLGCGVEAWRGAYKTVADKAVADTTVTEKAVADKTVADKAHDDR